MTLQDRCLAYAAAFPDRPRLQVVREQNRDVIYGTWMGGQNYRAASTFYGSYPPGYLERVMCLFPDVESEGWTPLHVFSGSLPPGPYLRLDINPDNRPDYVGSVYEAREIFAPFVEDLGGFRLVLADPPYSAADAEKYGTAMVDRRRTMAALAQVTRVGGHLVWLDQVWPMHSKREWVTVGRITLIRSTNHRVRLVSIFERVAA